MNKFKQLIEKRNTLVKALSDMLDKADEEKRAKLLDNLRVADEMLESRKDELGFQGMTVEIDENGEMTVTSSKSTVTFNGEKRARQIAAAQTQGDLETVMRLLQVDLEQCEAGCRNNACDEAEVQKVKDMIAQAEQRKGELGDTSDKENDPAAKAAECARGVAEWIKTGRFPELEVPSFAYVRGETFPVPGGSCGTEVAHKDRGPRL